MLAGFFRYFFWVYNTDISCIIKLWIMWMVCLIILSSTSRHSISSKQYSSISFFTFLHTLTRRVVMLLLKTSDVEWIETYFDIIYTILPKTKFKYTTGHSSAKLIPQYYFSPKRPSSCFIFHIFFFRLFNSYALIRRCLVCRVDLLYAVK